MAEDIERPRTVVVTGGASGMGAAIAADFLSCGDRVIVLDAARNRDGVPEGATDHRVDITDAPAIAEALAEVDHVDVLVNAAGVVGGMGALLDIDLDDVRTAFDVNVLGTLTVVQQVAPLVRPGGAIVTISSIGARRSTPGLGHYEATKAALDSLIRALALELAPRGIRSVGVAPGPVATPFSAGLVDDAVALAVWESRIPLGRIARVDDIVPLVRMLASDGARHITGVTIPVDGGQLIR